MKYISHSTNHCNSLVFRDKMKHTVRTVLNSNLKIRNRGIINTPNTLITAYIPGFGIGTAITSRGV